MSRCRGPVSALRWATAYFGAITLLPVRRQAPLAGGNSWRDHTQIAPRDSRQFSNPVAVLGRDEPQPVSVSLDVERDQVDAEFTTPRRERSQKAVDIVRIPVVLIELIHPAPVQSPRTAGQLNQIVTNFSGFGTPVTPHHPRLLEAAVLVVQSSEQHLSRCSLLPEVVITDRFSEPSPDDRGSGSNEFGDIRQGLNCRLSIEHEKTIFAPTDRRDDARSTWGQFKVEICPTPSRCQLTVRNPRSTYTNGAGDDVVSAAVTWPNSTM